MSRVDQAILQAGTAYAAGANAPMLDLTFGGMMGFSPEYAEWVSNQSYIRKNLIPILVEAPKAFQLMPNPDILVRTLRSLVELHPISIDGLNATLQVDVTDTVFGGSGQMQHDPANVKETQSTPNFHYVEKYGRSISRFLRMWITYLLMDPYTKFANLATLSTATGATDLLADMYSMTVLFIEPDPLMRKVTQSWLVTNMFPKNTGDIVGSMDKNQDGQTTNIEVQFTGIHQYGAGVDAFAQKVLDGISIAGANPYLRNAFVQNIDVNVAAAQDGFAQGVTNLANNVIRV